MRTHPSVTPRCGATAPLAGEPRTRGDTAEISIRRAEVVAACGRRRFAALLALALTVSLLALTVPALAETPEDGEPEDGWNGFSVEELPDYSEGVPPSEGQGAAQNADLPGTEKAPDPESGAASDPSSEETGSAAEGQFPENVADPGDEAADAAAAQTAVGPEKSPAEPGAQSETAPAPGPQQTTGPDPAAPGMGAGAWIALGIAAALVLAAPAVLAVRKKRR